MRAIPISGATPYFRFLFALGQDANRAPPTALQASVWYDRTLSKILNLFAR
jgi:hypothetical protein